MPETYDITLAIKITKTSTKEALADETFYFSGQSVASMANRADKFFELITSLQKIK